MSEWRYVKARVLRERNDVDVEFLLLNDDIGTYESALASALPFDMSVKTELRIPMTTCSFVASHCPGLVTR